MISHGAERATDAYSSRRRPPLAFVRICAHYFLTGRGWRKVSCCEDAARLAGIPGVLIHGRLDLGGPVGTAWELAKAWPDARLVVVDDSGHTGSETMKDELLVTLERFAAA